MAVDLKPGIEWRIAEAPVAYLEAVAAMEAAGLELVAQLVQEG